jgi:hypothetical protein
MWLLPFMVFGRRPAVSFRAVISGLAAHCRQILIFASGHLLNTISFGSDPSLTSTLLPDEADSIDLSATLGLIYSFYHQVAASRCPSCTEASELAAMSVAG